MGSVDYFFELYDKIMTRFEAMMQFFLFEVYVETQRSDTSSRVSPQLLRKSNHKKKTNLSKNNKIKPVKKHDRNLSINKHHLNTEPETSVKLRKIKRANSRKANNEVESRL